MRYLYAATMLWASILSAHAQQAVPDHNSNTLACPGKTIHELHEAITALVESDDGAAKEKAKVLKETGDEKKATKAGDDYRDEGFQVVSSQFGCVFLKVEPDDMAPPPANGMATEPPRKEENL